MTTYKTLESQVISRLKQVPVKVDASVQAYTDSIFKSWRQRSVGEIGMHIDYESQVELYLSLFHSRRR
ncbi:hypothetical protein N7478_002638 [Penicillium angulare]|uniref:uncharacterized protein n=1 Tax=Penicillium angulare TaxID=116970 RepID=UPI00253F916C|nr:uncharacterized protein N7478_002638 [Penicillium angulare]KAJ5286952.1 hypothetical protein N7478_002638 [Penicillium angulare]